MPLQLLTRFASLDRSGFDADAENRSRAGLGQLQVWTEDGGAAWVLFSVNDRGKARAWLDKSASLGHAPEAHHFLETT
ncbi:hypothetical protein R5H30_13740 [Sulfitobacter sp. D35]|uniref:hypothetical protein n=1 Tax=Sulfitobacter sp. D35 TaxID=3083252 RepID=UPI00296E9CC9|nr:hypothetical protein [Sulfitobacter sp. D35]MDW4499053.1 hypothetical protein [Sulfitobacter sp. D35]